VPRVSLSPSRTVRRNRCQEINGRPATGSTAVRTGASIQCVRGLGSDALDVVGA
jgi:hypothetical protein